ncbi:transposase [Streptomyces sp. Ncost-T10-10d]|uniref:transposase n=1 Tax=Streptomyces sp. Ncost-T10-10d TaxID=1839774 RepID=UPI00159F0FC7
MGDGGRGREVQRRLSRRAKGSRNRNKQRIKVVKAHTKVADARRGFHHKLSMKLMRENQAVGVERPSPDRRPCEPLGCTVRDACTGTGPSGSDVLGELRGWRRAPVALSRAITSTAGAQRPTIAPRPVPDRSRSGPDQEAFDSR